MTLPQALLHSLKNIPGFDQEAFVQAHDSNDQVTSVRSNPSKFFNKEAAVFTGALDKVPWCSTGYYLKERPSFTADPLFHGGAYYVQEASSMFLEQALTQAADLTRPLRILDLCAAPGGKSTLIQSLISEESLLISNEVIKPRVNILSENVAKWGAANIIVTNNDPKDFQRLTNYFDIIVVDAPCSGSGLFKKDPAAITEWSEQNVALCSQRQQRILSDILPALKVGGLLIYSTCSYSKEEDEMITDWLLENNKLSSVQFNVNNEWNIIETRSEKNKGFGYRFYPDRVKGEGFFLAAFRNEKESVNIKYDKRRIEKLTAAETRVIADYLKKPEDFFLIRQNNEAIAMPLHFEEDLSIAQANLYIKKAGVKCGAVIRTELIPDHELAVSTIIGKQVPYIDVDKATSLQYLRRQEIKFDSANKGWFLLRYSELPLGWVKILPNRVNNYYPATWRILNK